MFKRENWVGILLLGVCIIVGWILIRQIFTGARYVYTGPGWVPTVLGLAFLAAAVWGWWRGRGRRF